MTTAKLKPGWTRVKFGDVVRLVTDRCDPVADGIERYVGLDHIEPEDLRIRRWGLVAEGVTFTNRFKAGQVLFGKRRAYQRKVAVADFEGVCSGDIYVFEPADDRLLPELLPFICQTEDFYEYAVKTSAGSLSPRTNWKSLADYGFALPPLDEQRRISRTLEMAELLKQSQIELLGHGTLMMSSLASEVLHQNLLEEMHSDRSVAVPAGWTIASFGDVCERITYGFTNPMPNVDEGPWMVTATDIHDGAVDYSTARHTSQRAYDELLSDKSRPKVGDVLLTKDGTLGRIAIVDRDDMCINQSVALLRPNIKVLSAFLAWSLRAPLMQRRLILDAGGSAVKHIYITKVAKTRLLLPSIPLQSSVVQILNGAEATMNLIKERHHKLLSFVHTARNAAMNGD